MGIKGIYKEIGTGQRVSLCKLAVDQLERKGRPLRLAIDISIWQFQVQAAKGGANPAIRTLFYRLVRLLGLSIQPLFVFDGPNKPAYKRNKRSHGPGNSVATAMAKRLIRLFGFDIHDAPGEAEAECALLQRQGIVDAVLSEDVDTIMFGCSRTLRNWTAESKGAKTPTHVSMYDVAELGQSETGLDREGMVLVAMMSGGDYIPAGVPGCGVKVACEAAKAGFGRSLCKIKRSDKPALEAWRKNLVHELRTNESGFFRTRHKALDIPEDFPNLDVLRFYTHPVVSPEATVENLRREFPSNKEVDVAALRAFVLETFDWTYKIGAIKFIRVLAPSLLVQKLLAGPDKKVSGDQAALIKTISSKRSHFSTDATPELRISYIPNEVVRIDLDAEPEEVSSSFGRDGLALNSDDEFEEEDQAKGAKKLFDPLSPDLVWIPESVAKVGAPKALGEWQEKQRAKELKAVSKAPRKTRMKPGDMPAGALDKYVKVIKAVTAGEKETGPAEQSRPRVGSPPRAPVLGGILSSSHLALGTTQSTFQPAVSPSAKSKPPKKTSRPKKPHTSPAAKPTAQTNPWTLAGSQVSPRVTKSAVNTHPPSSPKPAARKPSPRRRDHEPIVISSSPPTSPTPTVSAASLTPRTPRIDSSRAKNSYIRSPVNISLSLSPRKGAISTAQGPGRAFVVQEGHGLSAQTTGIEHSTARRAAESDSSGSPRAKTRALKRTKSVPQDGTGQKQASITDFVLKDAGGGRVNARPGIAIVEPIEISDDDDDDDDDDSLLPPISALKLRSCGGSRALHTVGQEKPRKASLSSPLASQSPPNFLPDMEEGPSRIPSSASAAAPREHSQRDALHERATRTSETTKLYVPRKSEIGYFKEVEVTKEEADRIMSGESTHEALRGSLGRVLRRSDVTVVDLTDI
ncbi:hypothetical protein GQ53DRAFT_834523 [Thozetella sp. PMI_491]|nr:hypothetical protein GQ53DRAFT_834523 [Thozetella sp. PMI_491]